VAESFGARNADLPPHSTPYVHLRHASQHGETGI
jgi:hypothetical protein